MDNDVYIIIGTAYLECDEDIVKREYLKNTISVSNTVFERKLFTGFKENGAKTFFLSCPSLGYYPISLKKTTIKGLKSSDDLFCLKYNAILGFSGASKKNAFIKKLKSLVSELDLKTNIHLILCEAHKPYLDVAQYAKLHNLVGDVTLLVPDLPEHNIRSKNILYKALKKQNTSQIYNKIDKFVDRLVLFSQPMASLDKFKNKNLIVNEGISNGIITKDKTVNNSDTKKHIVFIGKLDERNGVSLIYEAAKSITDKDVIFDLYGVGGNEFDSANNAESDNVINHGFLKPSEVQGALSCADILLSPRFSAADYTKYSFPSKLFDYLESMKPVISFRLESYPTELDEIIYYPENETSKALCDTIDMILENKAQFSERLSKYPAFINKYSKEQVAQRIISFIKKQ